MRSQANHNNLVSQTTRRGLWFFTWGSLLSLAACGDSGDPSKPQSQDVPPAKAGDAAGSALSQKAALKAIFDETIALAKANNREAVVESVLALMPSVAELKEVVRPGPAAEAWLLAYEGPIREKIAPAEAAKAGIGDVDRTEVLVHEATTESLAAYERGTTAWDEFPGGMKRFAREVAAPGRVWFAVETRKPGAPSGTRYTCLTKVGNRFVLVVKPWRALPEEEGAEEKPADPSSGESAPPAAESR